MEQENFHVGEAGQGHEQEEELKEWNGDFDPFGDPEERRVLFATLDSFRYEIQDNCLSSFSLIHFRAFIC